MVIYYERNKVIFLESDYHIFGMVIKNEKLVFLNGAHGSLLFMKQKKIGWYGKQFLGKILISKIWIGSNGNSWIQNGMSILIDFWNPYHNHFFSLGCFLNGVLMKYNYGIMVINKPDMSMGIFLGYGGKNIFFITMDYFSKIILW